MKGLSNKCRFMAEDVSKFREPQKGGREIVEVMSGVDRRATLTRI